MNQKTGVENDVFCLFVILSESRKLFDVWLQGFPTNPDGTVREVHLVIGLLCTCVRSAPPGAMFPPFSIEIFFFISSIRSGRIHQRIIDKWWFMSEKEPSFVPVMVCETSRTLNGTLMCSTRSEIDRFSNCVMAHHAIQQLWVGCLSLFYLVRVLAETFSWSGRHMRWFWNIFESIMIPSTFFGQATAGRKCAVAQIGISASAQRRKNSGGGS